MSVHLEEYATDKFSTEVHCRASARHHRLDGSLSLFVSDFNRALAQQVKGPDSRIVRLRYVNKYTKSRG